MVVLAGSFFCLFIVRFSSVLIIQKGSFISWELSSLKCSQYKVSEINFVLSLAK